MSLQREAKPETVTVTHKPEMVTVTPKGIMQQESQFQVLQEPR